MGNQYRLERSNFERLSHCSLALLASLNFRLDPSEKWLVWCFSVALSALLIAGCAAHRDMALLLFVGDDWGLQESWGVLLGDEILLRHGHWAIVASVCMRCHRSHRLRTTLSPKVVCLISSWLESTLIEAQVIVFFSTVGTLGFRDAAANFIWVTKLVESLVVGCLEIVVNHSALLLLPKSEIVAFQFSF